MLKPSASGSRTSRSTRSGSGGLLNSALISARLRAKRVVNPPWRAPRPRTSSRSMSSSITRTEWRCPSRGGMTPGGVAGHRDVEAALGELRAAGLRGFLARGDDLLRRWRRGAGFEGLVKSRSRRRREASFASSSAPMRLSSPRTSFTMFTLCRTMRTTLMTTTAAKKGPKPRKYHAATGANRAATIAPSEE